jgi:carbonic anhydrase
MLIPIIDGFKAVYNSSATIQLTFDLNDVIPTQVEKSNYYQYVGSLTTPPCTVGIFWTVFEEPINISSQQVP